MFLIRNIYKYYRYNFIIFMYVRCDLKIKKIILFLLLNLKKVYLWKKEWKIGLIYRSFI